MRCELMLLPLTSIALAAKLYVIDWRVPLAVRSVAGVRDAVAGFEKTSLRASPAKGGQRRSQPGATRGRTTGSRSVGQWGC